MQIDLRSDTVTRPTEEMLKAMMNAPVGDDVFGEDPTVKKLEEKTAALFGHEAGVFCPSGTMTNQIAIKVHTRPGDEVICESNAHIYNFEGGGIGFNSGAQAKLITGKDGIMTAAQVAENINGDFDWLARTSLVSVENTGNRSGGGYYKLEEIKALSKICQNNNLKFHLDGARIFNALVETGDAPSAHGKLFDSVSVCLSKGLGAPVGSVLVGSKAFIKEARRVRKVFGGGMRQAGIIAAAGIYAIDNNVERLKEDHKRASELGKTLSSLSFVEEVLPVKTNIIIFRLNDEMKGDDFVRKLAEKNIRASAFGKQTIRFVTHLDINDDGLQEVISVLKKI